MFHSKIYENHEQPDLNLNLFHQGATGSDTFSYIKLLFNDYNFDKVFIHFLNYKIHRNFFHR